MDGWVWGGRLVLSLGCSLAGYFVLRGVFGFRWMVDLRVCFVIGDAVRCLGK